MVGFRTKQVVIRSATKEAIELVTRIAITQSMSWSLEILGVPSLPLQTNAHCSALLSGRSIKLCALICVSESSSDQVVAPSDEHKAPSAKLGSR